MFFEDEKDNLDNIDNLDDLDLDLDGDIDDESISWDELLKDNASDLDIVSITSGADKASTEKASAIKVKSDNGSADSSVDEIQDSADLLDNADDYEKKDAFEVFGGKEEKLDIAQADNVMDDENQEILNQIDEMVADENLADAGDAVGIGIKQDPKALSIPVIAGAVFATVLVLGSLLFIFTGPKKDSVNVVQNIAPQVQTPDSVQEQENVQLPDEQDEQIPIMDDKAAKNLKPDKKVLVDVESAGRVNPFLPTFDDFNNNYYAGIPSEILAPPDKYGSDTDAQELLKVAVSGILFDNVKPSAIITINGLDYFVQKGDMVDDYIVMDINRQFVVVKKGTNIYKAGVGERFSQNTSIDGAAVYGSAGTRQYKSIATEYTSASDVEVHAIEE